MQGGSGGVRHDEAGTEKALRGPQVAENCVCTEELLGVGEDDDAFLWGTRAASDAQSELLQAPISS